ncbi:MAG: hypothetical protein IT471_04565 [Pseudomonadales bacterium]|nr:hypothetical protein [Pseudomonadales bacterium]MCP5333703.1 hypothetical protein [Pseudomonadales bacterium]
MKYLFGVLALVLSATPAMAADVSFSLCNKFGTGTKTVVIKDKKANMKKLFEGAVARDACQTITAYSTDGKFAEIEITVEQGTPYGVPWIAPGDSVSF